MIADILLTVVAFIVVIWMIAFIDSIVGAVFLDPAYHLYQWTIKKLEPLTARIEDFFNTKLGKMACGQSPTAGARSGVRLQSSDKACFQIPNQRQYLFREIMR